MQRFGRGRRRVYLNLSLILVFVFSSLLASIVMAESTGESTESSAAKVHIIYTERPTDEEPKTYHLRTLSSALGSEEAAKDALIYSYREAASGFSAKLTPDQVAEISKQPGVIQVVESQTYHLHKPGGGGGGGFKLT